MQNHNNGVFVISLDAVDLNLLPTIYNERPDKVSPLWSRSNLQMRTNDYYQFEIKCKDCDGSNKVFTDKPPKHEYKNKICHICDIEVPILFWSDHRKSVRHKANVKIADIAIQRMKKYLNEAEHEIDDDLLPSARFCPTCVTVIDSEDSITHEKSPSHRNAYIVEKFLNDFLILYNVNESYANDVPNEQINKQVEHDIANSNIVNKKTKKIYTDSTVNVTNNPIDKNTAKQDIFKLNAYIDLLNKRNDIQMFFKVVNENLIEIEAVDGSIVRVADKNFNGFNMISRKHTQCLLCKLNFKEKKADAHMMSSKHIMNIIVPLKDKHCLRYIDADYYHCVICNTITENSELHLLCNENHEKLLKIALISDKLDKNNTPTSYNMTDQSQIHEDTPKFEKANDNQQSANNNQQSANDNQQPANDNQQSAVSQPANKNIISYADMLQTYNKPISHNNTIVSTSKEVLDQTITNENALKKPVILESSAPNIPSEPLPDKLGHIGKVNKLPENKIFCEICNKFISKKHIMRHKLRSKHVLNSISDPLYLMSEIDSTYLLCKICHIRVIKNLENVREHILDEDHKLKYKNILAYNSVSRIDQYTLYCKLCDDIVVTGNEIIHIDTKEHRFKRDTTEMIGLSHNENVKEDEQENHASDEENDEAEQTNHDTEFSKTFEFYQCTVCDVKVPNYTNNIQEHLNGRVHLRNLEKYSVDSNNKTQDSVGNYHYHMEQSEFPSCLNCIVCDINILYKEDTVTQHLNDLTHTKNYEILLENNFLVNHTDDIYCNLCKVAVGVKGEILHIKGRKHKKNIEKHNQTDNKPVASEINEIENININIQTENYPSETLIRVAAARNIEPKMIIFLKEIDDSTVECVVCKVHIPFTEYNVRTHMNGTRHAKNINSESTNDVTK